MTSRKMAIREVLTATKRKVKPASTATPATSKTVPKKVWTTPKRTMSKPALQPKVVRPTVPAHYQMVISETPCGHCGFIYFCADDHECLSCGVRRGEKIRPYTGW